MADDIIEIGILADSKPVNNLTAALGKASNAANLADKNFRDLERALKQGIGGGADNLLKVFARLERAGMSLSDVNKGLAQDAKMLAQANQHQINSLLGVDRASKSARASAEAMKEAFRAQEVATINTAKQTRVLAGTQSQAAIAAQKLAAAQRLSGRTTNKFGMISQQVGYQVGDFFVQVQSGTNKFVAFGQQATQLAGLLPGLAGAIVGISISVGTLLLSSFDRMKKSAEDTDDVFKKVADNLNNMNSAARDAQQPFSDLAERFGESASKARLFLQVISAIQSAQFQKGFSEAADSLRSLFDVGDYASESIRTLETAGAAQQTILEDLLRQQRELLSEGDNVAALALGQKIQEARDIFQQSFGAMQRDVSQLAERLGVTEQVATEFAATLSAIGEAKTFEEKGQAAVDLAKFIRENVEITDQLTVAENEAVQKAVELALKFLEASNNADAAAASAGTITSNVSAAADEAIRLAMNLQSAAVSAEQAAGTSIAVMNAQMEALNNGQNAYVAGAKARLKLEKEAYIQTLVAGKLSATEAKLAADAMFKNREAVIDTTLAYNELQSSLKKSGKVAKKELSDAEKAALEYAKALDSQVISAIDGISNAWGEFVVRGFKDFKGFANAVLNSFKSMLVNMIAMAAKNQIMLSLGIGGVGAAGAGAAAAGAAGAGAIGGVAGSSLLAGGGMLAGTGTGMALAGVSGGLQAALGMGGYASAGLFNIGANAAVASAATGAGAIASTIGAAIPVIGAVAIAFMALRKKTKELDSGLKITVGNMDALVETFRKVETSRFFGLSKKTRTSGGVASNEISDPIVEAVSAIQQSAIEAAAAFGIAESAFDNFSYNFQVSLKGLTEEQKMQKINEELTKMGDAFAGMLPHFESLNELLQAAEQRYQIENRMLQALGNSSELLARSRERELAATHALNRGLLQATFDLEDANAAVSSAMEGLRRAIDAEKAALQKSFDAVFDGLKERLDLATEAVSRSRDIFNMLSNSLKSRSLGTMEESMFRRSSALSFLQSGDINDEVKLENALRVVSEPSEGLFTSFVDYAREFLQTSRVIGDLEKTAAIQLSADEKAVVLLEQQIEANKVALEAQLAALDQQYQTQVDQLNALLGIDTSVKSVGEAIATLRGAIEALAAAQNAAKAAASAGVGGGAAAGGISQFSTGTQYKGFDLLDVGGASGLLQAAGFTGVSTSGKTGLQIAQEIANITGKAVQLDAASRVQKFARGGVFGGGMRLVGEEGPELEVTGPSRIYSKQQTKDLLRGDSNDSDGLRMEVSEMRQELRQLLIANNKYTKRSYDLYNKWDIDGLPAERT